MKLSILEYAKGLLPHIERDRITEDLRITTHEFENAVLPSYQAAAAYFTGTFSEKLNTNINSDILDILKPVQGYPKARNFIVEYERRLKMIAALIPVVDKLIDQEIGRDVVTQAASVRKIVLMRIVERFSYISRHSLLLLNLIYVQEVKNGGSRALELSPAEVKQAKACVGDLARMIDSYSLPPDKFLKDFTRVPDLLIDGERTSDIEAMYKDEDLDPISTAATQNFAWSPIYHLRMMFAEWQAKRYKNSQDLKKVLELRLLHLQIQKDQNGTNPKLEQEIQYTQDRLAKTNRYMAEVEEDLGVAA